MDLDIKNSKGQNLAADIDLPRGKTHCVIMCHGFTSNKDDHFFPELAAAIKRKGVAALRFDFTGNGSSEGTFAEGTFSQQVADVRAVVDYLAKQSKIISIGILGHSMGASVAAMAAAEDVRIKEIALLNCATSLKKSSNKTFFKNFWDYTFKGKFEFIDSKGAAHEVDRKYVKEFRSVNMFNVIQMVRQKKLFVNSTDDKYSDDASKRKLFEVSPGPKKEVRIEGADHNFKGRHKEVIDACVDFFEVYL